MVLLAAYAAYTYLTPPLDGGEQQEQVGQLKDFVKKSSRLIQKGELSKRQDHSINMAETGWRRNPFQAPPLEEKEEGKKEIAVGNELIYSGFLEGGKSRIAIINGLEYQVGESLQGDEFIVQSISPDHVVLGVRGKSQTVTVPFSE